MTELTGLSGTNPRDFLATLGLIRIVARARSNVRLRFRSDGSFVPVLDGVESRRLMDLVLGDVESQAGPQPWRLQYEKNEKKGSKRVADLKPPPKVFTEYARKAVESWVADDREAAAYAAAFATDVAVDGKGNTKPTAFHFTAANQQLLDTVERLRDRIDSGWLEQALFSGHAERDGPNLRWDPGADRAYALMASDPKDDDTAVNAPLEWLAFRGLPLFPVVPCGRRAETTAVRGRGDEMQFRWPLWAEPASLATAASLVRLDWRYGSTAGASTGVIAVCTCVIRRTGQGFGNFGPARIESP